MNVQQLQILWSYRACLLSICSVTGTITGTTTRAYWASMWTWTKTPAMNRKEKKKVAFFWKIHIYGGNKGSEKLCPSFLTYNWALNLFLLIQWVLFDCIKQSVTFTAAVECVTSLASNTVQCFSDRLRGVLLENWAQETRFVQTTPLFQHKNKKIEQRGEDGVKQ